MVSFPYHSHTTPIRIPKDMGMVWEASHKGVPLLGVPGITLDSTVWWGILSRHKQWPIDSRRWPRSWKKWPDLHPALWIFHQEKSRRKKRYIQDLYIFLLDGSTFVFYSCDGYPYSDMIIKNVLSCVCCCTTINFAPGWSVRLILRSSLAIL